MSLSRLFNRLCYQMELWGLGPEQGKVMDELRKEGWKVKSFPPIPSRMGPMIVPAHIVYTPEGHEVSGNEENYRRYHDARVKAAAKIYGPHI